jgi:hypothetical protein
MEADGVRVQTLGLHEQAAFLRLWWPTFSTSVKGRMLTSEGEVRPTEMSQTYWLYVSYGGGETPEVRVVHPKLEPRAEGGLIPHMYGQEGLCLYLPGSGQWTPAKPIAVTILPWSSLWLYFYEVWRATGEWMGGGVEPDPKRPIRREHFEHAHDRRRKRR